MFDKIKGKLKGVFSKNTDDIFDEDIKEDVKVNDEDLEKTKRQKKKVEKSDKKNKKEVVEKDSVSEKTQQVEEKEGVNEEDLDFVETEDEKEEVLEEKKGFFSKIFKKSKEEKELEEVEKLEDEMLEGVSSDEIEAIKEHKDLKDANKNLENIEKKIEKEEVQEKKELKEIKTDKKVKDSLVDSSSVDDNELDVKDETDDKKPGFFSKTFGKLTSKKLSQDDFDKIWLDLEIFLLEINIAFEIVQNIEQNLKNSIIDKNFDRFSLSKKIREVLVEEVQVVLEKREANLLDDIKSIAQKEDVVKILILGVNGTGKTTTIAKFVHFLKKHDLTCVVAASDTFRAAALEQLDEHAQRVGFKLIKHKGGSDPAAVAYDAIEHARAKKLDIAIIDTAGRMPNNSNLMQELSKVQRVSNSDLNIFVGDSVSGNDLMDQIELFDKIIGINGIILTKTDTDEKPGSIVTAAYSIDKPIYYLGIGQNYDDLVQFNAKLIANKLFEVEE